MVNNNVSEEQSVWDDRIKKYFRVTGKIEVIGRKNPIESLVETLDCGLMEDSLNYKITKYAHENLKDYFKYIDGKIKELVHHVFYRACVEELEQKNFVMSMATEILNSCQDIKESIMKKAEEICVPSCAPYVALAIYVKEKGKSPDVNLLEQKIDKIKYLGQINISNFKSVIL